MLKVSFEFDEESKAVTNVKVVKVPSKYDNIDLPIVEIGDSKLIMSPKAVSLLSAQCGDRIAVNSPRHRPSSHAVVTFDLALLRPFDGRHAFKGRGTFIDSQGGR